MGTANAVARTDYLEFLSDIIPQTTTYRAFKEKRTREQAQGFRETKHGKLPVGQTTLDDVSKAPAPDPELESATDPHESQFTKDNHVTQHHEANGACRADTDREVGLDGDGDIEMIS